MYESSNSSRQNTIYLVIYEPSLKTSPVPNLNRRTYAYIYEKLFYEFEYPKNGEIVGAWSPIVDQSARYRQAKV